MLWNFWLNLNYPSTEKMGEKTIKTPSHKFPLVGQWVQEQHQKYVSFTNTLSYWSKAESKVQWKVSVSIWAPWGGNLFVMTVVSLNCRTQRGNVTGVLDIDVHISVFTVNLPFRTRNDDLKREKKALLRFMLSAEERPHSGHEGQCSLRAWRIRLSSSDAPGEKFG